LGGIGDDLIAASVCRPLKKLGYKVDMITASPNHVLFYNNPFIDKLSVKNHGDLPLNDHNAWLAWFESRRPEYDVFAQLSHSCEAKHAFFPGMTQFWLPENYRRDIAKGSYIETVHKVAEVPFDFGPLFFSSEEERERALETRKRNTAGKRVVGWVISGSRIDKIYPQTPTVISRLIREHGVYVMLFGAPNEKEHGMAETIQNTVNLQNSSVDGLGLCMTAAGSDEGGANSWPIRRSLSQLLTCDLVVTPDTGSAWAVAFEQMPKILLCSHASDENVAKHWVNATVIKPDTDRVPCWPCHRLHERKETCVPNADDSGAACISDMSVEGLLTAIKGGLGCESSMRHLVKNWPANLSRMYSSALTGYFESGRTL
jgi:ADP-heptose:LPS heptosyltransferase